MTDPAEALARERRHSPATIDQAIGELRGFARHLRTTNAGLTAAQLDAVCDEVLLLRADLKAALDKFERRQAAADVSLRTFVEMQTDLDAANAEAAAMQAALQTIASPKGYACIPHYTWYEGLAKAALDGTVGKALLESHAKELDAARAEIAKLKEDQVEAWLDRDAARAEVAVVLAAAKNYLAAFDKPLTSYEPGDITKASEQLRSVLTNATAGAELLAEVGRLRQQLAERDAAIRMLRGALLETANYEFVEHRANIADRRRAALAATAKYAEPSASQSLTVEQARQRNICRICGCSVWSDKLFVFNDGREYAHQVCLDREKESAERPYAPVQYEDTP